MPWILVEGSSGLEKRWVRNDGLAFLVGAILASGLLALVATWFLVNYSPIPDDDAINYGLIGFFVVSLVYFFVFQAIADLKRMDPRILVIKKSVRLLLLGLLVASVVGSIPWLWSRLVVAMPWLPNVFWLFVLLSYLPGLIALWKRWRARQAPDSASE